MRLALVLVASTLVALPASAQLRPITVGVSAGTLGIGPEVSYRVNPFVAVRGSATFFGLDGSVKSGDFRYRGRVKVNNFGGTVDVHPLANGFRLSAGARSTSHNRIRFTGRATGSMSYMNMVFSPDQIGTVNGVIHTKSVSPIITAGYSKSTLVGLTFGIDAGVMFHGTPTPRDFSATGELGTNPYAADEYARQRQRVRDYVDGYKYYPVLQLSLGYRF